MHELHYKEGNKQITL